MLTHLLSSSADPLVIQIRQTDSGFDVSSDSILFPMEASASYLHLCVSSAWRFALHRSLQQQSLPSAFTFNCDGLAPFTFSLDTLKRITFITDLRQEGCLTYGYQSKQDRFVIKQETFPTDADRMRWLDHKTSEVMNLPNAPEFRVNMTYLGFHVDVLRPSVDCFVFTGEDDLNTDFLLKNKVEGLSHLRSRMGHYRFAFPWSGVGVVVESVTGLTELGALSVVLGTYLAKNGVGLDAKVMSFYTLNDGKWELHRRDSICPTAYTGPVAISFQGFGWWLIDKDSRVVPRRKTCPAFVKEVYLCA